jgi:hypothetical protein
MIAAAADLGFLPLWRKIRDMTEIRPESWTENERSERLEALDRADAPYGQFLAETQPFSACMRAVVYNRLLVTRTDFKRMSDSIRVYRNLPTHTS